MRELGAKVQRFKDAKLSTFFTCTYVPLLLCTFHVCGTPAGERKGRRAVRKCRAYATRVHSISCSQSHPRKEAPSQLLFARSLLSRRLEALRLPVVGYYLYHFILPDNTDESDITQSEERTPHPRDTETRIAGFDEKIQVIDWLDRALVEEPLVECVGGDAYPLPVYVEFGRKEWAYIGYLDRLHCFVPFFRQRRISTRLTGV